MASGCFVITGVRQIPVRVPALRRVFAVDDPGVAAETAGRIAELVAACPGRFGLPDPLDAAVEVRRLGAGESSTAWLVSVGDAAGPGMARRPVTATAEPESVVVRVAARPVDRLPRPMAAEFAALALRGGTADRRAEGRYTDAVRLLTRGLHERLS